MINQTRTITIHSYDLKIFLAIWFIGLLLFVAGRFYMVSTMKHAEMPTYSELATSSSEQPSTTQPFDRLAEVSALPSQLAIQGEAPQDEINQGSGPMFAGLTGFALPSWAVWASELSFKVAGLLLLTLGTFLFVITRRMMQVQQKPHPSLELTSPERVAIYDWDIQRAQCTWSDGLSQTFGYRLDRVQLSFDWWVSQIHPDDQARVLPQITDRIEHKPDFITEYRFRTSDGRYLHVCDRALMKVLDNSRRILHIVGSMEDLTPHKAAETDLLQQSHLYKPLLQAQSDLGDGLAIVSEDKILYANQALSDITGYTTQEIVNFGSLFKLMPPDEQKRQRKAWKQRLSGQPGPTYFESVVTNKDGRRVDVEVAVKEVTINNLRLFMIIGRDITQRKQTVLALHESERKYSELVRKALDPIILLNRDRVVEIFNPAAELASGYSAQQIIGQRLDKQPFIVPSYLPKVMNEIDMVMAGRERPPFELELLWRDGATVSLEANPRHIRRNGYIIGVQLTLRDISKRKKFEEELAHHVLHDPLTKLPNRTLFRDRVERALARAERQQKSIALLILDLDRFKVVNDSLGYTVGDQLLIQVAERLKACMKPGDTVARLGGDEFTILLEDVKGVTDAIHVAERIADSLSNSFTINGHEFFVTSSIGIVLSTEAHQHPDDLLRDADVAMYRAKEHGKAQYEVFDASMNACALERLQLETALRQAIDRQALQIYYQPLVRSVPASHANHAYGPGMGEIVAMEALVRWPDPTRGMISPKDFIPLAEETGLIQPLGEWILAEACRQLREWQQVLPPDLPIQVNVNLSARQFEPPDLVEKVAKVLKYTGLPAGNLKIELTETVFIEDTESTITTLYRLKALGIKLAIDDFGTGWSSLSYLKRFPIDALKIDQAFVRGLLDDAGDQAIVLAVITLARTLGLQVIAEGVENAKQMSLLNELGCDIAQGYYFSKPLPADEMFRLLKRQYTLPMIA